MEKVYREAYASADSGTLSILQVGLVSTEYHEDAPQVEDRTEHEHVATFSSVAHYWRRGRQISVEKHNVHLSAVAHDGYSSLCNYLRPPTRKRPLHELEPAPCHSLRSGHQCLGVCPVTTCDNWGSKE